MMTEEIQFRKCIFPGSEFETVDKSKKKAIDGKISETLRLYKIYALLTSGINIVYCFQGDSGGPLVLFRYGYYTQVGIVSFGATKCEGGYPAGFTRVTSYLSWIQSVTSIPIF
jgi:hypothetical protein